MLAAGGDWMALGSADGTKARRRWRGGGLGTRQQQPGQGWNGINKGLRGRFGMYVPPVLEVLGLAEVEHNPRNNRMRAK